MGFLRRLFGGAEEQPAQDQTFATWLLAPKGADASLNVVGEGSYQDGIGKVAGGKMEDGPVRPNHVAILLPQPSNRFDPNAIMVLIDGTLVGYLSREDAIAYAPSLAYADSKGRKIACNARITGGWQRSRSDVGSYGVVLNLGGPMATRFELAEMAGEPVVTTVRIDHPWAGQLIAFTGDSLCLLEGMALDRGTSEMLASRAGLSVHPRVTKQVQLLVDCDPRSTSGNERKANQYGIPVVAEAEFWAALGVPIKVG